MAERGDIVLSWLVKIVAILCILGVISYDGISLTHVVVSNADTANRAAFEASDTWSRTKDVHRAYDSAETYALQTGATVQRSSFAVDSDGRVHLVVHRTAPTIILRRIGPLRHYAEIWSPGTGKLPA